MYDLPDAKQIRAAAQPAGDRLAAPSQDELSHPTLPFKGKRKRGLQRRLRGIPRKRRTSEVISLRSHANMT